MCRNIKPLFNFNLPATEAEVREASLQYIRKLFGSTKPSKINDAAFNRAVDKVAKDTRELLSSLITNAEPHNREVEALHARERSVKCFGS